VTGTSNQSESENVVGHSLTSPLFFINNHSHADRRATEQEGPIANQPTMNSSLAGERGRSKLGGPFIGLEM
jgi:hypothetical protein